MNQSDFLARFKSNSTITAPTFDRDALELWASEFRASLPARRDALIQQFAQALEAAGGKFYVAPDSEDAAAIALDIAKERSVQSVVAWNHPVLEVARTALTSASLRVVQSDARAATRADIRAASAQADLGLTSCDFAIAETGTLLLVGNDKQGRLTSLLPITHVAIITPDQLMPTLADCVKLLRLQRLASSDGRLPSNISLHTGPSKTGDIEQVITKGVHGPKEVHVILQGQ